MLPAILGLIGALGGAAIPAISSAVQRGRDKRALKRQQQLQQGPQGQTPNYVPNTKTGNWFTGYGAQSQQLPRFTPQQEQIMQQLAQQGTQAFSPNALEAVARRDFAQKTIPSIMEALGGQNALSSPTLHNQLASAGVTLDENLAALRANYAQAMLNMGLQPTFENIYLPATQGAGAPFMQALGQSIPGLTQAGVQALTQFLQNMQQQQTQQQFVPQAPAERAVYQPYQSPLTNNLGAVTQPPTLQQISRTPTAPVGSTLGNMQLLQQNSLFNRR